MIEAFQSDQALCPRCKAHVATSSNDTALFNYRCYSCDLLYRCASNRGGYFELVIYNPPRDPNESDGDSCEPAILLRWYVIEDTAYLGTRDQHKRKTAMNVGWPSFNIPIDTIKMWLTFS